MTINKN